MTAALGPGVRVRYVGYSAAKPGAFLPPEVLAQVFANLVVGRVYTVRLMRDGAGCCACNPTTNVLLDLAEFTITVEPGTSVWYCACGFRPEDDSAALMEQLSRHLKTAPRVKEPAG